MEAKRVLSVLLKKSKGCCFVRVFEAKQSYAIILSKKLIVL